MKQRIELKIDQLFRNQLSKEMVAIVTFSDADQIFGQRTIRISNGVDFDSIPLHKYQAPNDGAVHMLGVAEVHIWHAFDRLIAGIGVYYSKNPSGRKVYFHIVGGVHPNERYKKNVFHPGLQTIIDKYNIQEYIIFHGPLFGNQLDKVFNQCCFAIGSLGRHRSGITVIKTLKNREYATRGIPFIYSEEDSDFDHQPYVLKAVPDESPINVGQILSFLDNHSFDPMDIRKTVEHLSWKIQMQKVLSFISS